MKNVVTTSRPFASRVSRGALAAAFLAAVCVSGNGLAQSRLSLAERVAQLEAKAAGSNSQQQQLELLNRISDLQTEVQQLRADLEKATFELQQLKKTQRDQYLDLDSRLRGSATQAPSAGAAPVPSDVPVSESAGMDSGAFSEPQTEQVPSAPAAVLPPSGGNSERAAYDLAFESLKLGQYPEASKRFASFLANYPNGEFADNATYWLGESYYVTQKYQQALKTFQDLLNSFPQSKKAPDSLLKVGYCYYQLGDAAKASSTLKSVIDRYPDQPVAKLAEGRLRALQLDGR
jgi:tol-pal system protein YbgF